MTSRTGWAARRANKCDSDENGAHSWDKWQKCCPAGMKITVDSENNSGCSFGDPPANFPEQCADPDLVLWYDNWGKFCCDADLKGFATKKEHWKGCATSDEFNAMYAAGNITNISQKAMSPDTTTSASTLTSQTSASTTTSESSSTSADSESHGSSTNKGAIAGGVVGGVCGALLILGLLWFFLRRRRSSSVTKHEVSEYAASQPSGYSSPPGYRSSTQGELYGTATSHEVPGTCR
ncbi:hypothetical protein N7509_013627 [Penicillium cosmopolitanum]|uniref:Uncharacterized protein n=1 Tax=Penicillium cosmopolitanum TaxID=1131564 RepID=A0A9W9SDQ6_9EURO|nr:uncharacterized protein N7509_013627 [Penicillium cosmopolitanum]KAJ5376741.1 hypothetical protein N7509_013627 [Penicillium cosmopolitanum]